MGGGLSDGCWVAPGRGIPGQVCNSATILRSCGRLAILFFGLALAACSSTPELVTSIPHTSSFAANTGPAYQLRADDTVKLVVFGQESISGDYKIGDDGTIDISQVGKVHAAGLTVDELEIQLVDKLRHGIVENPQVSVLLDAYRPISITGAVQKPGDYPFRSGLDTGSAIALAGGYNDGANTVDVFITHAGAAAETRYTINDRPVINPGDTIRIPNRG